MGRVDVLDQILARAARNKRRIVFPESDDPRTIGAVARLARDGIVQPVLLDSADGLDRSSFPAAVEVVQPGRHERHAACVGSRSRSQRTASLSTKGSRSSGSSSGSSVPVR